MNKYFRISLNFDIVSRPFLTEIHLSFHQSMVKEFFKIFDLLSLFIFLLYNFICFALITGNIYFISLMLRNFLIDKLIIDSQFTYCLGIFPKPFPLPAAP